MTAIVKKSGKQYQVKNLGWLRRNAALVTKITVVENENQQWEAKLIAHLDCGGTFECDYADKVVLVLFLERWRNAQGLPINWYGKEAIVDKNLYKLLPEKEQKSYFGLKNW